MRRFHRLPRPARPRPARWWARQRADCPAQPARRAQRGGVARHGWAGAERRAKAQSFSRHAAGVSVMVSGHGHRLDRIQRGRRTALAAAGCCADLVGQPVAAAAQLVAQRGARRHGVFSGGCRPRAVWRGPARPAGPLCPGAGGAGRLVARLAGRFAGQRQPARRAGGAGAPPGPALAGAAPTRRPGAIAGANWPPLGAAAGLAGDAMARQPRRAPDRTAHQTLQRPLAARMAHAGENRRRAVCRPATPPRWPAAGSGRAGA